MYYLKSSQQQATDIDASSIIAAAKNIDVELATNNDPFDVQEHIAKEVDRNIVRGSNTVMLITQRLTSNVSIRKLKYKDHDRIALISGMLLNWLENES